MYGQLKSVHTAKPAQTTLGKLCAQSKINRTSTCQMFLLEGGQPMGESAVVMKLIISLFDLAKNVKYN